MARLRLVKDSIAPHPDMGKGRVRGLIPQVLQAWLLGTGRHRANIMPGWPTLLLEGLRHLAHLLDSSKGPVEVAVVVWAA